MDNEIELKAQIGQWVLGKIAHEIKTPPQAVPEEPITPPQDVSEEPITLNKIQYFYKIRTMHQRMESTIHGLKRQLDASHISSARGEKLARDLLRAYKMLIYLEAKCPCD